MHPGREARLERLTRRGGNEDGAAIERQNLLRARAAIGAAVRWSLARHGIDPTCAPALRVADEAAAELAALGDPPPLAAAEPPAGDRDPGAGPLSCLDDRIGRLVARYREGNRAEPDFARASLAELHAWCIAVGDGSGSD